MDDAEQDPTDYILAPGDDEEECSVPADVPDDRVSTTAKFVNFKATGKERWTEALPCMLCCFSAARQQCCHRASCAESDVGALTRLLTLFPRKMNDALFLMGPCIRPVRFTTDTESLQAQRDTKRQEFLREKKRQEFFLATQDPRPNFLFVLVKRS
jgi:hypothetical protein